MEDLMFKVEKVPVEDLLLPKGLILPSGSNHAIVRIGESKRPQEIITFCSEDYGLTRNEEIKKVFDEILISHGIESSFGYAAYGHNKFRMDWTLKSHKAEIRPGDIISPRLTVYNSYDRRLKFSFMTSVQRLVCSNGLSITEHKYHSRSLHTTEIAGFASAVNCIPMINEFMEEFDELIEPYYDLQTMKVPNIEARVDEVIEETSYPASLRETALERIYSEIHQYGYTPTDWLIYSGLNYAIVHEPQFIGRKSDELDQEILTYLYS